MSLGNDEAVYQIALDADLGTALKECLATAAREAGLAGSAVEIEEVDPSEIESSLEFEPFMATAILYVAKIIVEAGAAHLVGKALDRLLKTEAKPVIVIIPSGELLRLDPKKPEELQQLLDRLKSVAR